MLAYKSYESAAKEAQKIADRGTPARIVYSTDKYGAIAEWSVVEGEDVLWAYDFHTLTVIQPKREWHTKAKDGTVNCISPAGARYRVYFLDDEGNPKRPSDHFTGRLATLLQKERVVQMNGASRPESCTADD